MSKSTPQPQPGAEVDPQRLARLALPAITVVEWAKLHGCGRSTALWWAAQGQLGAWRSGATWLCRPDVAKPLKALAERHKRPIR